MRPVIFRGAITLFILLTPVPQLQGRPVTHSRQLQRLVRIWRCEIETLEFTGKRWRQLVVFRWNDLLDTTALFIIRVHNTSWFMALLNCKLFFIYRTLEFIGSNFP